MLLFRVFRRMHCNGIRHRLVEAEKYLMVDSRFLEGSKRHFEMNVVVAAVAAAAYDAAGND